MSSSGVGGLNLFQDVILPCSCLRGLGWGFLVYSSMLLSALTSCNKGAQGFSLSCMVLFCSGFWAAGSGFGGHQYHER